MIQTTAPFVAERALIIENLNDNKGRLRSLGEQVSRLQLQQGKVEAKVDILLNRTQNE